MPPRPPRPQPTPTARASATAAPTATPTATALATATPTPSPRATAAATATPAAHQHPGCNIDASTDGNCDPNAAATRDTATVAAIPRRRVRRVASHAGSRAVTEPRPPATPRSCRQRPRRRSHLRPRRHQRSPAATPDMKRGGAVIPPAPARTRASNAAAARAERSANATKRAMRRSATCARQLQRRRPARALDPQLGNNATSSASRNAAAIAITPAAAVAADPVSAAPASTPAARQLLRASCRPPRPRRSPHQLRAPLHRPPQQPPQSGCAVPTPPCATVPDRALAPTPTPTPTPSPAPGATRRRSAPLTRAKTPTLPRTRKRTRQAADKP